LSGRIRTIRERKVTNNSPFRADSFFTGSGSTWRSFFGVRKALQEGHGVRPPTDGVQGLRGGEEVVIVVLEGVRRTALDCLHLQDVGEEGPSLEERELPGMGGDGCSIPRDCGSYP